MKFCLQAHGIASQPLSYGKRWRQSSQQSIRELMFITHTSLERFDCPSEQCNVVNKFVGSTDDSRTSLEVMLIVIRWLLGFVFDGQIQSNLQQFQTSQICLITFANETLSAVKNNHVCRLIMASVVLAKLHTRLADTKSRQIHSSTKHLRTTCLSQLLQLCIDNSQFSKQIILCYTRCSTISFCK